MGKGKPYVGEQRDVILKVLSFFEKEKKNGKPIIPVRCALNRASEATGVSIRTLRNIRNEAKTLRNSISANTGTPVDLIQIKLATPQKRVASGKKLELDKYLLCSLKQLIENFYSLHNEMPTLRRIFEIAKTDLNFPGQKTSLRKILKEQLGYKFIPSKVAGQKWVIVPSNDCLNFLENAIQ